MSRPTAVEDEIEAVAQAERRLAPSGAGTVGLCVHDGSLLIGTFAGDRIVRVMPQQAKTP